MLRDLDNIKHGERKFNEYHLGAQQSPEIQQMIINALTGYKKSRSKRIALNKPLQTQVMPLVIAVDDGKSKLGRPRKNRLVQTPNGIFESLEEAAAFYDVSAGAIKARMIKKPSRYFFIDK